MYNLIYVYGCVKPTFLRINVIPSFKGAQSLKLQNVCDLTLVSEYTVWKRPDVKTKPTETSRPYSGDPDRVSFIAAISKLLGYWEKEAI